MAPASVESPDGVWKCFTDVSTDLGQTWKRSAAVRIDRSKLKGEGAIQPSLIEYRPGRVTMLTRSSTGHVLRADSEDSGQTWSDMYETPLFNNNSGLDALKMDSGQWLVVHNPVQQRWVGPETSPSSRNMTDSILGSKNAFSNLCINGRRNDLESESNTRRQSTAEGFRSNSGLGHGEQ